MTLKARLVRLETAQDGTARVIVVKCPEGSEFQPVLEAYGIDPAVRDLVVVIADPVATKAAVTVDGFALKG